MNGRLDRLCVFCGSSSGASPRYAEAARSLAAEMVKRNVKLVYGGGNVGLMGAVAHAVHDGLGEGSVLGVIPEHLLPREVSGETVGEIRVTKDMHSRKATMATAAQGFVALPGGFGTLEELMEVVTWHHLGYHAKPIGLLNVEGFFDHLLSLFDHMTKEGFLRKASRDIVLVADDPAEVGRGGEQASAWQASAPQQLPLTAAPVLAAAGQDGAL